MLAAIAWETVGLALLPLAGVVVGALIARGTGRDAALAVDRRAAYVDTMLAFLQVSFAMQREPLDVERLDQAVEGIEDATVRVKMLGSRAVLEASEACYVTAHHALRRAERGDVPGKPTLQDFCDHYGHLLTHYVSACRRDLRGRWLGRDSRLRYYHLPPARPSGAGDETGDTDDPRPAPDAAHDE